MSINETLDALERALLIPRRKVRDFVDQALRAWEASGYCLGRTDEDGFPVDFLAAVSMGAGKTDLFCMAFLHLFNKGLVDRVMLVVPSEEIKRQIAGSKKKNGSAFDNFGIELIDDLSTRATGFPDGYHGAVVTYAQVAQPGFANMFQGLARDENGDRVRWLVCFDEPHHMGDERSWGDAARVAFRTADYRFLATGTAFRSDRRKIPFVSYRQVLRDDGQLCWESAPDFSFGYPQAIDAKYCLPVVFHGHRGKLSIHDESFMDVNEDGIREFDLYAAGSADVEELLKHEPALIRAAIRTEFAFDLIDSGLDRLERIRRGKTRPRRDAAMLVVADRIPTAYKFARYIASKPGYEHAVKVVHSPNDEYPLPEEPSDIIEGFRSAGEDGPKVIIAVGMISEGVDIERLYVGCLLTDVKTMLFWMQVFGRLIRGRVNRQTGLLAADNPTPHMYFIGVPSLIAMAKAVEDEMRHLIPVDEDGPEDIITGPTDPRDRKPRFLPVDGFAEDGTVILRGDTLADNPALVGWVTLVQERCVAAGLPVDEEFLFKMAWNAHFVESLRAQGIDVPDFGGYARGETGNAGDGGQPVRRKRLEDEKGDEIEARIGELLREAGLVYDRSDKSHTFVNAKITVNSWLQSLTGKPKAERSLELRTWCVEVLKEARYLVIRDRSGNRAMTLDELAQSVSEAVVRVGSLPEDTGNV